MPIPQPLELGTPWAPVGDRIVAYDDFVGEPGELAGRATRSGARVWRRDVGHGRFLLTGDGAVKVEATLQQPCPGRTAYTIPWGYFESAMYW